jgi:acyl phosphate:glycerol-3-phosphate acyltransferase
MADNLIALVILIFSYLVGSIPFGLIIVKLRTGQDVRKIESGRTGGTNVGRVAGFWAGFATAFLDGIKGAIGIWLGKLLLPDSYTIHALAGVVAVLGHNYSIFLAEKTSSGSWRLRGGAGGATTVGAAFGLWWPSILIIIPVGAFALLIIGYASLATLSVGLGAIVIFAVRAWLGLGPWEYIIFGVLVELALIWALRPNIRRLFNGTERLVGVRAKKNKPSPNKNDPAHQN